MKSPDDDFNWMIRAGIAIGLASLVAAFAFGMFVQARLS
jgi:F0F1-type ATP synthase membrane subunit c/vacuolar-type H+-ATPase subunit K